MLRDLLDDDLASGEIPAGARRWHRALAPRFEEWARRRNEDGRAGGVAVSDIAGTEWPMFGSVFFLAASEALQDAYDRNPAAADRPPAEYASGAIDAAAALLVDPANATWVRQHWGDDYLERENVFYRMLLIMGLTSHARLTAEETHLPLLRQQVESLAAEIDASPYGLLDDYPGESYPTDVLWAVSAIRGADRVIGTDHSAFVARFFERCRAPRMLGRLGLLPYAADADSGAALDDSRGCANSAILIHAPLLSPADARLWYERYATHFWQQRSFVVGFREYPLDDDAPAFGDVDSGPIVLGYGFAASAFGLAAARVNGRLDHAAPLAALAIAATWPLPDGTLLLPRVLSNATDAPYLGEAGMLYIFTRTPAAGFVPVAPGGVPSLVYVLVAAYFLLGAALIAVALRDRRQALVHEVGKHERLAFALWALLLVAAGAALGQRLWLALLLLLAAHAVARRVAP